ncbi:MAG TPA: hypothetical protein VMB52_00730, partial [Verrucomicrobiae bacterium]|nr:hypothetical protein [Verrucomicrobiae bacterium]
RDALLAVADGVFAHCDYRHIEVGHIASRAAVSVPTFYGIFSGGRFSRDSGKNAWGVAVLDQRLNAALDQEATTNAHPHTRLLGRLSLLERVTASLPGITNALVGERTHSQVEYSGLLPRYYNEVTQIMADGQGQRDFSDAMSPSDMASSVLDSVAVAYAVHLDNPAARAASASLVVDGVAASR